MALPSCSIEHRLLREDPAHETGSARAAHCAGPNADSARTYRLCRESNCSGRQHEQAAGAKYAGSFHQVSYLHVTVTLLANCDPKSLDGVSELKKDSGRCGPETCPGRLTSKEQFAGGSISFIGLSCAKLKATK
jgi:hypothetical protein